LNRAGEHRRPRILHLADRSVLVDDPKDKIFTPFGDALEGGQTKKSREMYFATYHAIAGDESLALGTPLAHCESTASWTGKEFK
jgi:type I restriction enzyme R subunit